MSGDEHDGALPRIGVERVHDVVGTPAGDGEIRILVDRTWPRGIGRDRLPDVDWEKEAAPSEALLRAYRQEGLSWERFKDRYREELVGSGVAQALLARLLEHPGAHVTLLVSATDAGRSTGTVLRTVLQDLARI